MIQDVEIRHAHFFCGLGGGAKGFNKGSARVGNLRAKFRCLGGIDNDRASVADFEKLAGVPGTLLDLFDRQQYIDWHGKEPPADWREATPQDVHRAFQNERPNIVFLSAPCKGFSGLLSEAASNSIRYQALNRLTVRGVMLMCEAYKSDPVEFIIFENVPRIETRGRPLLDQICAVLRHYGYAVAETKHDCGEIGGLGQSRKRFLLVARHEAKIPPFLYQPPKKSLRGVGEILEKLPVPGLGLGGPMHRVPALQWQTWLRLAFVKAGSDWRSLNELNVVDGVLRDFGIVPEQSLRSAAFGVMGWDDTSGAVIGESMPSNGKFAVADPRTFSSHHNGILGVNKWDKNSGVVTGNGRPMTGNFSVADPRIDGHPKSVQLGVRDWKATAPTVTGNMAPGAGPNAVADPRIHGKPRFNNVFRIVEWGAASPAVTGGGGPAGGLAVADPRSTTLHQGNGKYRVTGFDEPAGAVIAASTTGQGAFAVADPRPSKQPSDLHGKYHVTPFDAPSRAVISGRDNGASVVADPRIGAGADRFKHNHRVTHWNDPAGTITSAHSPSNGAGVVADPRYANADYPSNQLGVTKWDKPAGTITGHRSPQQGKFSVADPRTPWPDGTHRSKLAVQPWDKPGKTVTGSDRVGSGALSVADPRPEFLKDGKERYVTQGNYGVVAWEAPRGGVTAHGQHDNGFNSVADPREANGDEIVELPKQKDRLVAVIRSLDGTWHRPFTTLELAALQSLVDPEEHLELDGLSDAAWRERIGNAVPPDAAAAIASVMGRTLLMAMTGQTFALSSDDIWVRPFEVALSVDTRQPAFEMEREP